MSSDPTYSKVLPEDTSADPDTASLYDVNLNIPDNGPGDAPDNEPRDAPDNEPAGTPSVDSLSPFYTGCCVIPCLNLRALKWFIRYRYYSIPILIPLFLVAMILTCLSRAPSIYRDRQYFHISNLGNWQSGLSFFTVFMVGKALLIYFLCCHVFKARARKLTRRGSDGQSRCFCASMWFFKFSTWCLPLGLIVTGCFQQSWSKPLHNVGVMLIGLGVALLFLADFFWYFHIFADRRVLFGSKFVIAAIVIISFLTFVSFNELAKIKWKAEAGEVECPSKYNSDSMFNGDKYPNYYPCKSKTLWTSEDPGWSFFCVSAVAEIFMFFFVAFYPATFWRYLTVETKGFLPEWIKHMYREY